MIIKTISKENLKSKIDQGDDFKLVMTYGEFAFQAKHIPGSINISRIEDAQNLLDVDDEIVVYCSNVACIASQAAYHTLVSKGYKSVRRYAGGIQEWEASGFPLEGNAI
jgi:rhodanese-related sulfurtransferase